MSSKLEKSALLHRIRVRKYREKAREKTQTSVYPSSGASSESPTLEQIIPDKVDPVVLCASPDSTLLPERDDGIIYTKSQNIYTCLNYTSSDSEDSSSDEGDVSITQPSLEAVKNEVKQNTLERLRIWASDNIAASKVDEALEIFKLYDPKIPKCSKTLLKTNLQLKNLIKQCDTDDPAEKAEILYFGIARHLQKIVDPALHLDRIIWLMFNIDGLPLYKSSSINFWITMCKIFHLLAKYKPFIISAYCGGTKPPSADVYLEDFVKELDELCENGIIIDGEKYEIKIKCFICDRPARSFVIGCTNHGGYYACERCCVEGVYINDKVVYPMRNDEKRTDESFTMLDNVGHHNSISH
ncbi:hypothetical protein QAD02_014160 [Eretmocerus hayati]|uniref:Uncharacterized protein n=1 Tax=Eretmocerus hayati TaxID=131215 RepID=A0ACC2P5H8_9HYME|nr:hypothetical protein QAD02_014160 [Eretmocerus hayati]